MLFRDYVHPDFLEFVNEVNDQGHKIGVVGGTVRDFLFKLPNKHDYDCEIRSNQSVCTIPKIINELKLKQRFDLEELSYNVYRLIFREFVIELSFPRIESYDETFSHSNFSAEFDLSLSYKEAALRRDFTINSMMFEFDGEWKLRDPLNGKTDLQNKLLKVCSSEFGKDPVRLLRAIRFKLAFGFQLDEKIKFCFNDRKLTDFNPHYMRVEAVKSGRPLLFISEILGHLEVQTKVKNTLLNRCDLEFDSDLKVFISSLQFLDKTFMSNVVKAFDLSINSNDAYFPIRFKNFSKFNLKKLLQHKDKKKIISTFKFLTNLDEKLLKLYYELGEIDIESSEIKRIRQIKMNLQEIDPKERSYADFLHKIRNVNFD